jgi:tetratricopeptide (TPR) repeat protein
MSKYNRKPRKPKDDEFVSFWARVFLQVQPYFKAIGIVSGTALAIVFVVWGATSYFEHKAQSAAEIFGRAVKTYDAELLTDTTPPKTDEENPIPHFKTEKERAEATLAELDKLDKQYGGSDVAKNALIFRGGVYFDQGRFDEAAVAYDKFLQGGAKDPSVAAIAREASGLCDEARGKLDEALAKYKAIEPKTGDYYRDRALYDQARIYTRKGDKKKAADLYKEILAKMPTTPLKDEIQSQLAVVEAT